MSLEQFRTLLERADWYCEWADNMSDVKKGRQELAELKALSAQSLEHEKLFNHFKEVNV